MRSARVLRTSALTMSLTATVAATAASTGTGNAPVRQAKRPFDDEAADAILRSSDGVNFRVYRLLLSLVSSVFGDILSLPSFGHGGYTTEEGGAGSQETPTMDVEEDADILESFLRWCNPRCTPPLVESWDDIQAMITMAIKYDAPSVGRRVSECMQGSAMVTHSPIRAYILAMRTGNRRLAQMAAREASRAGIETWKSCKEMEHMSGLLYHRLLDYHITCVNRAVRTVEELGARPTTDWRIGVPGWSHAEGSGCTGQWWKLYVGRLCAEVRERPDGFGSSRLRVLAQHTPTDVDRAGVLCKLCASNAHPHAMRFWSELAPELDCVLDVNEVSGLSGDDHKHSPESQIVLQLDEDQVGDGGEGGLLYV